MQDLSNKYVTEPGTGIKSSSFIEPRRPKLYQQFDLAIISKATASQVSITMQNKKHK